MKHVRLTVNEAAELRGVSRTSIYSAIARKKLPRRYFRGNLVVLESDLEAWEEKKGRGGRPKGRPMSEEHKAKLRAAYYNRKAQKGEVVSLKRNSNS
jgi:excisionase family DNA binding protein